MQELDEPGESGGVEMVRNEAYTTFMAEREEINDVIYEEVNASY